MPSSGKLQLLIACLVCSVLESCATSALASREIIRALPEDSSNRSGAVPHPGDFPPPAHASTPAQNTTIIANKSAEIHHYPKIPLDLTKVSEAYLHPDHLSAFTEHVGISTGDSKLSSGWSSFIDGLLQTREPSPAARTATEAASPSEAEASEASDPWWRSEPDWDPDDFDPRPPPLRSIHGASRGGRALQQADDDAADTDLVGIAGDPPPPPPPAPGSIEVCYEHPHIPEGMFANAGPDQVIPYVQYETNSFEIGSPNSTGWYDTEATPTWPPRQMCPDRNILQILSTVRPRNKLVQAQVDLATYTAPVGHINLKDAEDDVAGPLHFAKRQQLLVDDRLLLQFAIWPVWGGFTQLYLNHTTPNAKAPWKGPVLFGLRFNKLAQPYDFTGTVSMSQHSEVGAWQPLKQLTYIPRTWNSVSVELTINNGTMSIFVEMNGGLNGVYEGSSLPAFPYPAFITGLTIQTEDVGRDRKSAFVDNLRVLYSSVPPPADDARRFVDHRMNATVILAETFEGYNFTSTYDEMVMDRYLCFETMYVRDAYKCTGFYNIGLHLRFYSVVYPPLCYNPYIRFRWQVTGSVFSTTTEGVISNPPPPAPLGNTTGRNNNPFKIDITDESIDHGYFVNSYLPTTVFTPDRTGNYTVTLEVLDYCGSSVYDSVALLIPCNAAPVLNYDIQMLVAPDDCFPYFSGDMSRAVDAELDDMFFTWSLDQRPDESRNRRGGFSGAEKPATIWFPDFPGEYRVSFSVTDGCSIVSAVRELDIVYDPACLSIGVQATAFLTVGFLVYYGTIFVYYLRKVPPAHYNHECEILQDIRCLHYLHKDKSRGMNKFIGTFLRASWWVALVIETFSFMCIAAVPNGNAWYRDAFWADYYEAMAPYKPFLSVGIQGTMVAPGAYLSMGLTALEMALAYPLLMIYIFRQLMRHRSMQQQFNHLFQPVLDATYRKCKDWLIITLVLSSEVLLLPMLTACFHTLHCTYDDFLNPQVYLSAAPEYLCWKGAQQGMATCGLIAALWLYPAALRFTFMRKDYDPVCRVQPAASILHATAKVMLAFLITQIDATPRINEHHASTMLGYHFSVFLIFTMLAVTHVMMHPVRGVGGMASDARALSLALAVITAFIPLIGMGVVEEPTASEPDNPYGAMPPPPPPAPDSDDGAAAVAPGYVLSLVHGILCVYGGYMFVSADHYLAHTMCMPRSVLKYQLEVDEITDAIFSGKQKNAHRIMTQHDKQPVSLDARLRIVVFLATGGLNVNVVLSQTTGIACIEMNIMMRAIFRNEQDHIVEMASPLRALVLESIGLLIASADPSVFGSRSTADDKGGAKTTGGGAQPLISWQQQVFDLMCCFIPRQLKPIVYQNAIGDTGLGGQDAGAIYITDEMLDSHEFGANIDLTGGSDVVSDLLFVVATMLTSGNTHVVVSVASSFEKMATVSNIRQKVTEVEGRIARYWAKQDANKKGTMLMYKDEPGLDKWIKPEDEKEGTIPDHIHDKGNAYIIELKHVYLLRLRLQEKVTWLMGRHLRASLFDRPPCGPFSASVKLSTHTDGAVRQEAYKTIHSFSVDPDWLEQILDTDCISNVITALWDPMRSTRVIVSKMMTEMLDSQNGSEVITTLCEIVANPGHHPRIRKSVFEVLGRLVNHCVRKQREYEDRQRNPGAYKKNSTDDDSDSSSESESEADPSENLEFLHESEVIPTTVMLLGDMEPVIRDAALEFIGVVAHSPMGIKVLQEADIVERVKVLARREEDASARHAARHVVAFLSQTDLGMKLLEPYEDELERLDLFALAVPVNYEAHEFRDMLVEDKERREEEMEIRREKARQRARAEEEGLRGKADLRAPEWLFEGRPELQDLTRPSGSLAAATTVDQHLRTYSAGYTDSKGQRHHFFKDRTVHLTRKSARVLSGQLPDVDSHNRNPSGAYMREGISWHTFKRAQIAEGNPMGKKFAAKKGDPWRYKYTPKSGGKSRFMQGRDKDWRPMQQPKRVTMTGRPIARSRDAPPSDRQLLQPPGKTSRTMAKMGGGGVFLDPISGVTSKAHDGEMSDDGASTSRSYTSSGQDSARGGGRGGRRRSTSSVDMYSDHSSDAEWEEAAQLYDDIEQGNIGRRKEDASYSVLGPRQQFNPYGHPNYAGSPQRQGPRSGYGYEE